MSLGNDLENPTNIDGFSILSSMLTPDGGDDKDSDIPFVDPSKIDDEEDNQTTDQVEEKPEEEEEETSEPTEEETEVETTEETEPVSKDDEDFDADMEKEVAGFIAQRLSDELGVELDDDSKFESVKDIVDALKEMVEVASAPDYASEEVKQIDEYVRSGGRLSDIIQAQAAPSLLETSNIEDNPEAQKSVLREHMRSLGYDNDKIERAIGRYEDTGVLEDEAKDALDLLKKYKEHEKQALLEQQKYQQQLALKQQQEFVSNVEDTIESTKDVMGIPISEKHRRAVKDYIFKPGSDGMTGFQKDFDIKTLVETAIIKKFGNELFDKAKKTGSSDAYRDFHNRLKSSKKRQKPSARGTGEGSDAIDKLSSLLIG